jgi:hypothetical protein
MILQEQNEKTAVPKSLGRSTKQVPKLLNMIYFII